MNRLKLLRFNLALLPNLLIAVDGKNRIEQPSAFAKVLGNISQSKPVCWYSKNVAWLMRPRFGTELANLKYQALGREAQEALGIPQDRVLPIKKVITGLSPVAQAETYAICIDEEKIKNRSFGAQRSVFFHEACHVKYNDAAMINLSGLLSGVLAGVATNYLIKMVKPEDKYQFLSVIAQITISAVAKHYTESKFAKFAERRADTEGLYASQCAICVKEESEYTSHHYLPRHQKMGYLSSADITSIAIDLEQQNKKCAGHKLAP